MYGGNSKIFKKGTILTMTGGWFSPTDALVVTDGSTNHTGSVGGPQSLAELRAASVDLRRHCFLPGFIESHDHFVLSSAAKFGVLSFSPLL